MNYKEAIEAIKSNYPTENYTVLREALDLAIEVLQDASDEEEFEKFSESLTEIPFIPIPKRVFKL